MSNLPVHNYIGLRRAATCLVACNMTGTHAMSVARGRLGNLVLPEKIDAAAASTELMSLNHEELIDVVDGGDDSTVPRSPNTEAALNHMFNEMIPYAP